jgi:hypothetical protein
MQRDVDHGGDSEAALGRQAHGSFRRLHPTGASASIVYPIILVN